MTDAISRRYARALPLTAPKVAARTPCMAVDGYWIQDGRYYFRAEAFDSKLDRLLATPSLFD